MALGNAAQCQKALVSGECVFCGFSWRLEALDWGLDWILLELLTRKTGQGCIGERRKLPNSESRHESGFPFYMGFEKWKESRSTFFPSQVLL